MIAFSAEEHQPHHAEGIEGCEPGTEQHQSIGPNGECSRPTSRINSLLQKPFRIGTPARASAPMMNTLRTNGICCPKPPMRRISRVPNTVNDRACRQEQQRFENGMTEQMELAGQTRRPRRWHRPYNQADLPWNRPARVSGQLHRAQKGRRSRQRSSPQAAQTFSSQAHDSNAG